jgi:hypothetical protein
MSGFDLLAQGHKDNNSQNISNFKVIEIFSQCVEVARNLLCLVNRVRMVRIARKFKPCLLDSSTLFLLSLDRLDVAPPRRSFFLPPEFSTATSTRNNATYPGIGEQGVLG